MLTANKTQRVGGNRELNLADPELELIDPTPDVHSLFLHFDKLFFWTKLGSRVAVRWSKRMYSCAGVCSYECRSRFCEIAISEPLLKLRPRKDLVETLLHEMIHAYLFITNKDRDRDGHGPNFKEHMHRINKLAGVNITIYHDFHDEVELYQTHWWRCNGPCQTQKPYFGVVRRSANRAPGPNDYWWNRHQRTCGGTFVKIKEPAKTTKQTKPKENIMKYINNNKDSLNKNTPTKLTKPSIKNNNKKSILSGNNNTGILISKVDKRLPINNIRSSIDSSKSLQSNIIETVRNVWTNKQLPGINDTKIECKNKDVGYNIESKNINSNSKLNLNRNQKVDSINSPPSKIRKIDDYFKSVATTVLKDIYGEEFRISESDDKKLIASKIKMVDCPICNVKIKEDEINMHIDECLNKGIIDKITKSGTVTEINPTVKKKEKINVQINIKAEATDENTNQSLYDRPLFNELIKIEPGCSKDVDSVTSHNCPCCGKTIENSVAEHLDECLSFFDNDNTIPVEGASHTFIMDSIVLDDYDDDEIDETQTFNETGTKTPCPCCLTMIEQNNMNKHLDICLSS